MLCNAWLAGTTCGARRGCGLPRGPQRERVDKASAAVLLACLHACMPLLPWAMQDAARATRALSKTSPMLLTPGPEAPPVAVTAIRTAPRSPPRSPTAQAAPTSPTRMEGAPAVQLPPSAIGSTMAGVKGTAAPVRSGAEAGQRTSPPPSPQRTSPAGKTRGSDTCLPDGNYKVVQTKIGGAYTHMQDIWNT